MDYLDESVSFLLNGKKPHEEKHKKGAILLAAVAAAALVIAITLMWSVSFFGSKPRPGQADADVDKLWSFQADEIPTSNPKTQMGDAVSESTNGIAAEGEWERSLGLREIVERSDTAFIGKLLSIEEAKEDGVLKYKFRVLEDWYDNIPEEEVNCYFNPGVFDNIDRYEIGEEYLMITDRRSMIFYPNDQFVPVGDSCFCISKGEYLLFDQILTFAGADDLKRQVIAIKENAPEKELPDVAAFTLKVKLNERLREATPEFLGEVYKAEVCLVISGDETGLFRDENNEIFLTLMENEAEVGQTVVVDVVRADQYSHVYTEQKAGSVRKQ